MNSVRALAFYLPQFHPIPENDAWWGKGFTEWTNVSRARPLFPGHYQPHFPADLGFYDLRVPEVRAAQAELARRHGIHGFCYYHYWFGGRRLLNRPLDEILATGQPDFPFCLCWANESWTRRWDGQEREVLIEQSYSAEDDRTHLRWLDRVFRDRRYVRVDGRPLVLVYRASKLPDASRTITIWREEARRLGTGEIFIASVESFPTDVGLAPRLGFDAAVQFAPNCIPWPPARRRSRLWNWGCRLGLASTAFRDNYIADYDTWASVVRAEPDPEYLRFPCVTPGWDNSARRQGGGALILTDSTPASYQHWLAHVVEQVSARNPEHRLVFLNAWNEWAEGNHLEPCQKWGTAYLEATARALKDSPGIPRSAAT